MGKVGESQKKKEEKREGGFLLSPLQDAQISPVRRFLFFPYSLFVSAFLPFSGAILSYMWKAVVFSCSASSLAISF